VRDTDFLEIVAQRTPSLVGDEQTPQELQPPLLPNHVGDVAAVNSLQEISRAECSVEAVSRSSYSAGFSRWTQNYKNATGDALRRVSPGEPRPLHERHNPARR
jgi:hypothetical protein